MHPVFGGFWKCAGRALVLGVLAGLALAAQAAGLSPQDEQQIISVVKAQQDAFAADDAEKAFSFAAPNVRRQLVSAERFLAMVRSRYAVVYRPRTSSFLIPQGEDGEALLQVHLTDHAGGHWIASYTLQKQKNHVWRISGCRVDEAAGTMV